MGPERPDYLSAPLVHEAFAAIASSSPERQCLCYEGEWLSYGEVNARANAVAGQLSALGVGPGVVVGLMLERSFELVICILAVFKAGGCYLPCDPAYPDDRLSVYLEDGDALLVLVKTEHAGRAKSLVPAFVSIVDIEFTAATNISIASSSLKPCASDDPAYLIFTSGSTGRPKGVMVPHHGVRDHINGSIESYEMNENDKAVLSITINFDPHITQIFMPLILGAGLVIAKPEAHTDGEYMMALIATTGATHFVSTPSLAMLQFAGSRAKECTTLRSVMLCGEPLPQKVIDFVAVQVCKPSFTLQVCICFCFCVSFSLLKP
jgi:non-ribosomal peptide synthetase component F